MSEQNDNFWSDIGPSGACVGLEPLCAGSPVRPKLDRIALAQVDVESKPQAWCDDIALAEGGRVAHLGAQAPICFQYRRMRMFPVW